MKNALWISGIFLLMFAAYASATIINIPNDYGTIQAGINASVDGDTVLVQPGTYVENVNFNGHNIVLGSLFLTTGDTSYTSQTIIDGDSLDTVVKFWSEELATIIGFTIRNGHGWYGGGISCRYSDPVISDNLITQNISDWGGGGIFCWSGSSPTITNNVILNNTAADGGGLWIAYSYPTLRENTITHNNASTGGGVTFRCCSPFYELLVTNNVIAHNTATIAGGGIFSRFSKFICVNNTIFNNSASDGAGIWCEYSYPVIKQNVISYNNAVTGGGVTFRQCDDDPFHELLVTNNVIAHNIATIAGGGIFSRFSKFICVNNTIVENSPGIYLEGPNPNPIFINSIIWNNTAPNIEINDGAFPQVTYSDIQGGWPGIGNISVNPLFRDECYYLMSTACGDPYDSPCIDFGAPYINDLFLDCSRGLGTIASDMGGYGGIDYITTVFENVELVPINISFKNYPNPFNNQTTIEYALPQASRVTVDIFDVLGRNIATLVNAEQQPGYHSIIWDASNQASGMYFYRVHAGEFTETMKMLLLK